MVNTIYLLSFVETPRKSEFAIINLRGVSTKLNKYNTYIVFIMLHISLPNSLEPGDKISAVVAAAVHDIHHLGFANSFFCNASDSFTVLYNDIAC